MKHNNEEQQGEIEGLKFAMIIVVIIMGLSYFVVKKLDKNNDGYITITKNK